MVKRHLGIDVEQWDRLPWHHQLMYVEGLMEEFGAEQNETPAPQVPTRVLDLDEDDTALAQFGIIKQAV